MNAAIVSVPPAALAVVPAPAANTTTAPDAAPSRVLRGSSFASVYAEVMMRADDQLPDQVVHIADLRMTKEGHIELPGGLRYRLNPVAIRHLASALGLRWQKWFECTRCAVPMAVAVAGTWEARGHATTQTLPGDARRALSSPRRSPGP